jgi:hypothetical protein
MTDTLRETCVSLPQNIHCSVEEQMNPAADGFGFMQLVSGSFVCA